MLVVVYLVRALRVYVQHGRGRAQGGRPVRTWRHLELALTNEMVMRGLRMVMVGVPARDFLRHLRQLGRARRARCIRLLMM